MLVLSSGIHQAFQAVNHYLIQLHFDWSKASDFFDMSFCYGPLDPSLVKADAHGSPAFFSNTNAAKSVDLLVTKEGQLKTHQIRSQLWTWTWGTKNPNFELNYFWLWALDLWWKKRTHQTTFSPAVFLQVGCNLIPNQHKTGLPKNWQPVWSLVVQV